MIEYTVWGVYGKADDAKPEHNEIMTLDMNTLSEAVRDRAAVHGMIQRISDAAAMSKFDKEGVMSTPLDKALRMKKLIEHYESGTEEWSLKTGGGGSQDGLLLQVLTIARPNDERGKLVAFVGKLKPIERTKLLNSDRLRPIADRIRAEMSKGIDADAMLAELDVSEDADGSEAETNGAVGSEAE